MKSLIDNKLRFQHEYLDIPVGLFSNKELKKLFNLLDVN